MNAQLRSSDGLSFPAFSAPSRDGQGPPPRSFCGGSPSLGQKPPLEHETNADLLGELVGHKVAVAAFQVFGSLSNIAKATELEIAHSARISANKARRVKAALMLARRVTLDSCVEAPLLDSPEKLADLLREENRSYHIETFQIVLLNTRRKLIRVERVSEGTLESVLVHPREVFKTAILCSASAVALAHNHPGSGDPTPSEADIKITRDLIRAGQLLRIDVLDHIILGRASSERPRDFVSLRELGYFYP